MTEAAGPDRNRLHDLVRLVFDEAQAEGQDTRPVSVEQLAEGGPYTVEQITEHLLAEQEDTYVLEGDGSGLRVLALR